jgi:sterol desaturase/sphingolipid hydroxylase (fatty acid hydroxylase superfamily)
MLLILLPLHVSLFLVPTASFLSVGVFASLSLVHLHCIHSEFVNPWDSLLRKCGLVDSTFHHVHHLVPRSNLAHFFVGLDKLYGTYQDPKKYAAKLKVES